MSVVHVATCAQGNQITEDMVVSSLNLLSLGLHSLKQRLHQQQQQQQSGDLTLSRQECEVLEVILSAPGVRSREYGGPPLAQLQFPCGSSSSSTAAAAAAADDPLPGIIPSLSVLSRGTTAAPAAGPIAATAASPAATAAAGSSSSRSALSADVSSCSKALLPLAREVLGLVQGVLGPEGTSQGLMAHLVGAAEEEGDGRNKAKAAAQVG
jgi:hypothetical protein